MAEDVEKFIADHKLERPSLMGHSMGAKVAMTVALRNPSQISTLLPIDNSPVDAALKSDFTHYIDGMLAVESSQPTSTKQAHQVLERYEPNSLTIRHFLLSNLSRPPRDHNNSSSSPSPLKFSIPLQTLKKSLVEGHMADFPFKGTTAHEHHQFKGPTLVIRGTKSRYIPDDFLPVFGTFFPRFELLELETGHWVVSEDMEGFRRGVGEWFAGLEDGA